MNMVTKMGFFCVVNKVVRTVPFSGPGIPGDYNFGIYCIFQDPGVPGCTVLKSFIYFCTNYDCFRSESVPATGLHTV